MTIISRRFEKLHTYWGVVLLSKQTCNYTVIVIMAANRSQVWVDPDIRQCVWNPTRLYKVSINALKFKCWHPVAWEHFLVSWLRRDEIRNLIHLELTGCPAATVCTTAYPCGFQLVWSEWPLNNWTVCPTLELGVELLRVCGQHGWSLHCPKPAATASLAYILRFSADLCFTSDHSLKPYSQLKSFASGDCI